MGKFVRIALESLESTGFKMFDTWVVNLDEQLDSQLKLLDELKAKLEKLKVYRENSDKGEVK